MYFWENDPYRALEYATILKDKPYRSKTKIKKPSALGAIIDLGHCLNLVEHKNLEILRTAYDNYKKICDIHHIPIPIQDPLK